jgi:hypothetical protein
MNEYTHTLECPATPEEVWSVLADLAAVADYDPFVKSATLSGEHSGVGARRDLKLRPFGSMRQEVAEWTPNSSIEFRILRGMPVRDAVAFQRITATASGGSSLTMGIRFEPKRGLLGKVLGGMTRRRILDGLPRVANGVAARVEASR